VLTVRFIPIFSQHSLALAAPRQRWMLMALALGALLASAGCSTVRSAGSSLANPETLFGALEPYRVEVVQGNVVTKEVMAQVQPGLTRAQVRDILGTPVLTDVFHDNRWDYIFTIAKQGIAPQQRRVSLFFKGNVLERVEADALPTEREFVASVERGGKSATGSKVLDLTPAQLAALPVPAKAVAARKVPQGAARDYPPLEAGRP
jgi:outer membrane protein assembly factor BamE